MIDATQTTLYPGGILNTGFAVDWAKERVHDAHAGRPEGRAGLGLQARSRSGDQTCKDNQVLHGEAADLLAKIRANNHYVPKVADPLAPVTFVNKINVPVFMACQWTDEQTGGHCPTLAEHMTGTDTKWFTFTNGTHVDSLDPETFNRWYDFLELYVAQQAPIDQLGGDPARPRPVIYQAGDGHQRRDAAARPDPAAADLRRRAGGVRAAAADPRPVRQRRRQRTPGQPLPGLRAVVRELPGPGHDRALLVPRRATARSPTQPPRQAPAPNAFTLERATPGR